MALVWRLQALRLFDIRILLCGTTAIAPFISSLRQNMRPGARPGTEGRSGRQGEDDEAGFLSGLPGAFLVSPSTLKTPKAEPAPPLMSISHHLPRTAAPLKVEGYQWLACTRGVHLVAPLFCCTQDL